MGNLIKPVNPDAFNMGLPEIDDVSEVTTTKGPKVSSKAEKIDTFEFQFKHDGRLYEATITHSPTMGFSIDLKKDVNGKWGKSVSRLKHAILGAFILQTAMAQLNNAEDHTGETDGDSDMPEPKTQVTG